jgi:HSP20 family molecular chaperone IbpA
MANEKSKPKVRLRVWQPNGEMERMGGYFEDVFSGSFFPAFPRSGRWVTREEVWVPSIEIAEDEDKFLIKAELPGVYVVSEIGTTESF